MAEKFTRWADKSTGINPFLVDSIRSPNNLVDKIIFYGKMIFVGFPRLFVSSTFLLLFLSISFRMFEVVGIVLSIFYLQISISNGNSILQAILPSIVFILLSLSPPFHFVKKFCQKVLIKFSAYLLGIDYDVSFANTFRVVGVRSNSASNLSPFSTAAAGDVIISNLSNVLEIFLYEAYSSPLFVFPFRDSIESSLCIGLPFLSAISYTLNLGNSSELSAPVASEPLSVLIQKAKTCNRPIVLFIEGTKTNGSGVLEFPAQIFSKLTSPPNIHLSGLAYSSSSSSRDLSATAPTCPIGSHFERFLWLSSQLAFPQLGGITYLSSEFIPAFDSKRGMSEVVMNKWIEEIRMIFSKVVNKKPLKLSLQDFESFAKYFNALKNGKADVAKSIADSRGK